MVRIRSAGTRWLASAMSEAHTYKSKVSAYDANIKSEKSAKVANSESLNVLLQVAFTLNSLIVPRIKLLIWAITGNTLTKI